MTFGQWVKQTREDKKMSINALSKKAGIDRAAIYRIEGDDHPVKITVAEWVAGALGYKLWQALQDIDV